MSPQVANIPKADAKYFMPYQAAVIQDTAPLVMVEKGRQIGLSYGVSYKAVRLAAQTNAKLDVFVMSRDEMQSKLFLLYCKRWARVLNFAAEDLGEQIINRDKDISAHVLRFANGLCIYCVSSNPDAIVGKSGHVILDEFALHKDQRTLYAVAKPVIQWGGTLTIISTHRGVGTVFNELITDIKQRGNKMGWSLHTIPIQRAVDEGIVEKINAATNKQESRADFLARLERECIDAEQWQQEYCCIPADESQAFITYAMISACEQPQTTHRDFAYLKQCKNPIRIGFDVARVGHLSVIDVEEKEGERFIERMRIEMRNKTFAEQEAEFDRLMTLRDVIAAIDQSGIGRQLTERAVERHGDYRVLPISFTMQSKAELAYPLKRAHEDRNVHYPKDEALRNDLRGIKKEVLPGGGERFTGEAADSHCDRFWAKALALYAGKPGMNYSSTLI